MKARAHPFLLGGAILLVVAATLPAAEISGTVREVNGKAATIAIGGELAPAVGDAVEIFFKLAGTEDEISVATGKVSGPSGDAVSVRIEEASGSVEKGQLVRINSSNPQRRTIELTGTWTATVPGQPEPIKFHFRPDGTALIPLPGAPDVMLQGRAVLVPATKPPRFEVREMTVAPPPQLSGAEAEQFRREVERGMEAQGVSAQMLRGMIGVGEFDSPTQFGFMQFNNRAAVPAGAIGAGAIRFQKAEK